MNDTDILLEALASVESEGTGGYAAKNPQSSATGRYQFLWNTWGNRIKDFAKNPKLTQEEFRSNPELQDKWAKYYVENVLRPEAEKIEKRFPEDVKKRNLTRADLKTAIHFRGYPGASKYVRTGQEEKTQVANKSIGEYMEKARSVRDRLKPKASEPEVEEIDLDEPAPAKQEQPIQGIETGPYEAAARGVAKGLTFGFADRIGAAAEAALTGKSYDQALKESRAEYTAAEKEFPKTSLAGEIVGGAASMLVPGIGIVGRTAQTAKAAQAYKAAKAAGDIAAATAAKQVLSRELIRGGAQTGALAGLGGAEDLTKPVEAAGSAAIGAGTGAVLGKVIPEAAEKIAQSRVGQAVGKGFEAAKQELGKMTAKSRWQIPEFVSMPENQARVDEIVKQGQTSGLTDRQILSKIAVEFPDLPRESLEDAFKEKGVKGSVKRAIAGSQEAAEFIERPEQLARAEARAKGETVEMARLKGELGATKESQKQISREVNKLQRVAREDVDTLKNQMADLVEQYQMEGNDAAKKRIEDQIEFAKERLKLSTGIDQKKANLQRLEEIAKQNSESVTSELDKLTQTQTQEQLGRVARLRDDLNDQVTQLARQRSGLVETLKDVPATPANVKAFNNIRREIQSVLKEQGLGNIGRQALDAAFGGDSRIKPKTVGDIVGILYSANQKVSSAAQGTPLANAKRQIGEIIQERMRDISEEAYAIQRQLSQTKSNVSTIEKSPFFTSKAVPVTGKTGRVATAQKAFVKTELPDLTTQPEDYKDVLRRIGVDIDAVENVINTNRANRVQRMEPTGQLEQQIAQQETELGRMTAAERQRGMESQLSQTEAARQQLAGTGDIRRKIMQRKESARQALGPKREELLNIEDQLQQIRTRKAELGETENQLKLLLGETEGVPASIRDVGQAGVISAKGEVPFSIGKVLLPSPKTRIQVTNKIKQRFANPSLTSAVRAAIERPITMDVVRSLAMTHKVSEPELIKTFEENGITVDLGGEMEEVDLD